MPNAFQYPGLTNREFANATSDRSGGPESRRSQIQASSRRGSWFATPADCTPRMAFLRHPYPILHVLATPRICRAHPLYTLYGDSSLPALSIDLRHPGARNHDQTVLHLPGLRPSVERPDMWLITAPNSSQRRFFCLAFVASGSKSPFSLTSRAKSARSDWQ